MHVAALRGHSHMIRPLFDLGVDPNEMDNQSVTPLGIALIEKEVTSAHEILEI